MLPDCPATPDSPVSDPGKPAQFGAQQGPMPPPSKHVVDATVTEWCGFDVESS